MKKTTLTGLLCLSLLLPFGCDSGADAIKLGQCAAGDDTLSVVFKNPRKAVNYLDTLIQANEKGDRIDDTISLVKKVRACIEPLT